MQIKQIHIILLVFFVIGLFRAQEAKSQFATRCIDSTFIRQGAACPSEFDPVCGCDGVTYRNQCIAINQSGVQTVTTGICEALAIDFYPNPVASTLYFTLVSKEQSTVEVLIFDIYGKYQFRRYFNNVITERLDIDVSGFHHGLYYVLARSNGNQVMKKFARTSL